MSTVRPELIDALEHVQRRGADLAKERARIIWYIDRDSAGRTIADVQDELKRRGVELSGNHVQRGRYVGRLLYALDKNDLDPAELKDVTHGEVLYLLQRVHEQHGIKHAVLLEKIAEGDALTILKAIQRAGKKQLEQPEVWAQPFSGKTFPPDVTAQIDGGFKACRAALGVTVQQGGGVLARIVQALSPEVWRGLAAGVDGEKQVVVSIWNEGKDAWDSHMIGASDA